MAETIRIGKDRAVQLLREVVDEHGRETVYRIPPPQPGRVARCRYVHNGACSCLVGYALHRAGLTVEQLAGMDSVEGDASIEDVPMPLGVDLTESARAVFSAAQKAQDYGEAWGTALDKAAAVAGDWGDES